MKYGIILADPPWKYDFSRSKSREVENQYPTMALEDICALPVGDVAAKHCILYLWATAPKLLQALNVMGAWGFKYVTQAVWDKGRIGMGYWFRGQHEILLVGKRGNPSPPVPNLRVPSVFRSPRGRHSEKPEYVAWMIEQAFPDVPKLEMFARTARPNWDAWGDEAPNAVPLAT